MRVRFGCMVTSGISREEIGAETELHIAREAGVPNDAGAGDITFGARGAGAARPVPE